jgi:hypothetical protein
MRALRAEPALPITTESIPDPRDTIAWEDYIRRMQSAAQGRIHAEAARLQQANIIDQDGRVIPDTMPPDMEPGSHTSTITG